MANLADAIRATDEQLARLRAENARLREVLEGILHFSDAAAFRSDTLSVALRQWLDAGRALLTPETHPHD